MGALAKDFEFHLATAIIEEDSTFERDRVTVRHPVRSVTLSEGDWGGTPSRRQDENGNPRLVAGFNGVDFRESYGSEDQLVGTFLGLSEDFKATGVSHPLARDGG